MVRLIRVRSFVRFPESREVTKYVAARTVGALLPPPVVDLDFLSSVMGVEPLVTLQPVLSGRVFFSLFCETVVY